ncbi:MAG: enoyl-CoA hydratase-related protein [Elusimicrobia bacterium]|nr:enoyl-CoA hydratase-related protein [Elusimicrobiota bacterium]
MDYEILKTDEKDAVLTVTLSRPQALNALNSRFFREMDHVLAAAAAKPGLRAMIVTGEGKAFAAGADIAEMAGMDAAAAAEFSRAGQRTFRAIEEFELPVIAAVNGFALGGGCELALSCDIRIASAAAKFGQPEVKLGLTPGYAGTQRLPRHVGAGNALYLLLAGEMVTAEEALRMGLVQKVVAPEQVMAEALDLAKKIAARGPQSVRKVKRLVRQGLLSTFDAGCAMESTEFASLFGGEGGEGMKAFLEKRQPKW